MRNQRVAILKHIEWRGKKLLLFALRSIMRYGEHFSHLHDKKNNIRKILLLRLECKMGNHVMTTFLPEALKEIYPEAEIDVCIHEAMVSIWDHNAYINRLIPFCQKAYFFNPFRLIALLLSIRKSRYDVAISCSTPSGFSLSNGLMTRLTGGTYRVGFLTGESSTFLNCTVISENDKHYIDIIHNLLTLLTPIRNTYAPKIYLTDSEVAQAKENLIKMDVNESDKLVIFWVGAGVAKQWNIENFVSLANLLREHNSYKIVFLCGPMEKELHEYLVTNESETSLYVDDFRLLAGLIHCCTLFVSGDTGPLHLSAALRIHTVGIYLINNYSVYGYDDGLHHKVVDLSDEHDNVQKVVKACDEVMLHV